MKKSGSTYRSQKLSSDVMRMSQIVHEERENITVTDLLSSTISITVVTKESYRENMKGL